MTQRRARNDTAVGNGKAWFRKVLQQPAKADEVEKLDAKGPLETTSMAAAGRLLQSAHLRAASQSR